MKILKYKDAGNDKLLLFFNGWGASPELFARLEPDADRDYWVAYDYRGGFRMDEELSAYKEVTVVAWSLGVFVATLALAERGLPIVRAVAINGTLFPMHDTLGIPPKIFLGTLENLSEEGMKRFNRRMCGSREVLEAYNRAPLRPLDEVRDELQSLADMATTDCTCPPLWTEVLISRDDRIFPPANMRMCWQGKCPIREMEAPHYPFYLWNRWSEVWEQ